jgi:hypothetical protein
LFDARISLIGLAADGMWIDSGIGGANERGNKRQWLFDRVEWQPARLRSDLKRCVRLRTKGRRSSSSWPRWQAVLGIKSRILEESLTGV